MLLEGPERAPGHEQAEEWAPTSPPFRWSLAPTGKQNDGIALQVAIAPATVAKHLERIYRKLAAPSRTAAAALLDFRT